MQYLNFIFFFLATFCLTCFVPGVIGSSVFGLFWQEEELPEVALSICLAIGLAILSALVPLMLFNGLSAQLMQAVILILVLASLSSSWKHFYRLLLKTKELGIVWILFLMFCCASVLGPQMEMKQFVLSDLQVQFGLPIDNIIPFQTVRYVTEHISPNAIDPVPDWKFGDRGPLMGLFAGALFLLAGIKESLPWLSSSYPSAFMFEVVGVILNSIFLFPLFGVFRSVADRKFAYLLLAFLMVNPFVYVNVVFTWPKLFSVFYGILAFYFVRRNALGVAGAFLSLGLLAHESIVFSVVPFMILICFIKTVRSAIIFLFSSVAMQLPWLAYKISASQMSSHLLYHNMLCSSKLDDLKLGFFQAAEKFVFNQGIWEFLKVKIFNFLYPLNFTYVEWTRIFSNGELVRETTDILFYQFIYALGLVPSLALVIAMLITKDPNRSFYRNTFSFIFNISRAISRLSPFNVESSLGLLAACWNDGGLCFAIERS